MFNPALQEPKKDPEQPKLPKVVLPPKPEQPSARRLLRDLRKRGVDLSNLGFDKDVDITIPDKEQRVQQRQLLKELAKFSPSKTADTKTETATEQLQRFAKLLKDKNPEAAKIVRQMAANIAKASLDSLDTDDTLKDESPTQAEALERVTARAAYRFMELRNELAEEHGYFVSDEVLRESPSLTFENLISPVQGLIEVARAGQIYNVVCVDDKELVAHGFTTGEPTLIVVNLSKHKNDDDKGVDLVSTLANELAHAYLVKELGLILSNELPKAVAQLPKAPTSIDARAAKRLETVELSTRRVHELFSDTWSAKLNPEDTKRLVKNAIYSLVEGQNKVAKGGYQLSHSIVEAVLHSRDRAQGEETFKDTIKELRKDYATVRSFEQLEKKFERIDKLYEGYEAFEKLSNERIAALRKTLIDQSDQPKAAHATRLQIKAQQALLEARHETAIKRMTEIAGGNAKDLVKMRSQEYRDEVHTQSILAKASWLSLLMITETTIMLDLGDEGLKEIAEAINYYGEHFHQQLKQENQKEQTP